MTAQGRNAMTGGRPAAALLIIFALVCATAVSAYGDKKRKTADAAAEQPAAKKFDIDISKLVWPSPPSIARVRYLSYYAGMKIDYSQPAKKKQGWKPYRLAGAQPAAEKVDLSKFPFQLLGPYGIAIDSKGLVYVADQKVGAVFIFNTETHDVSLIRNGYEAHFGWINGLAIDDDDRLFVSDGKTHRVLVFSPKHEVINQIAEGLADPVGLAIDTENRLPLRRGHSARPGGGIRCRQFERAAAHWHRRQESLAHHSGRFRRALERCRRQRWKPLRHRHHE